MNLISLILEVVDDTAFRKLVDDIRNGIFYHGTTESAAKRILRHGFRMSTHGDEVHRALQRYGMKYNDLSPYKRALIRRSMEGRGEEYHKYVSVTHSPEVARRWAGQGSEFHRDIEGIADWQPGVRPSKFRGKPAILQVKVSPSAMASSRFRGLMNLVRSYERYVASGEYPPETAMHFLLQHYQELRVTPDQIMFIGRYE